MAAAATLAGTMSAAPPRTAASACLTWSELASHFACAGSGSLARMINALGTASTCTSWRRSARSSRPPRWPAAMGRLPCSGRIAGLEGAPSVRSRHSCLIASPAAEGLEANSWAGDIHGVLGVHEVGQYLCLWHAIADTQLTTERDCLVWKWSPNGAYSAQSCYKALFHGSLLSQSSKLIWRTWAPRRVKFFPLASGTRPLLNRRPPGTLMTAAPCQVRAM